jgi:hypothetical protein
MAFNSKPAALVLPAERTSALWLRLKANAESRLDSLRARNDKDRGERETAVLRGAIGELKYLLSLDKDIPLPPSEEQFKD